MSPAPSRASGTGDRDSSSHASPQDRGEIRPMPSDGNGRSAVRILIVEDDPDARNVCDTMLTRGGFVVETADNRRDGLESARTRLPDLVIMDINLPSWEVAGRSSSSGRPQPRKTSPYASSAPASRMTRKHGVKRSAVEPSSQSPLPPASCWPGSPESSRWSTPTAEGGPTKRKV